MSEAYSEQLRDKLARYLEYPPNRTVKVEELASGILDMLDAEGALLGCAWDQRMRARALQIVAVLRAGHPRTPYVELPTLVAEAESLRPYIRTGAL